MSPKVCYMLGLNQCLITSFKNHLLFFIYLNADGIRLWVISSIALNVWVMYEHVCMVSVYDHSCISQCLRPRNTISVMMIFLGWTMRMTTTLICILKFYKSINYSTFCRTATKNVFLELFKFCRKIEMIVLK